MGIILVKLIKSKYILYEFKKTEKSDYKKAIKKKYKIKTKVLS